MSYIWVWVDCRLILHKFGALPCLSGILSINIWIVTGSSSFTHSQADFGESVNSLSPCRPSCRHQTGLMHLCWSPSSSAPQLPRSPTSTLSGSAGLIWPTPPRSFHTAHLWFWDVCQQPGEETRLFHKEKFSFHTKENTLFQEKGSNWENEKYVIIIKNILKVVGKAEKAKAQLFSSFQSSLHWAAADDYFHYALISFNYLHNDNG